MHSYNIVTWEIIPIAKLVIATESVLSIMSKITCNLKTIAFTAFCLNVIHLLLDQL